MGTALSARITAIAGAVLVVNLVSTSVIYAQERPPSTIPLTIAGTVSWGNLGETSIGVVSCAQKEDHFNCNYFLKNNTNHTGDYKYGGQLWSTKLVDNFHIDHPLIRGYFENGLGKRQDVITLGKDEWFAAAPDFWTAG
jgi:hypothetical protein